MDDLTFERQKLIEALKDLGLVKYQPNDLFRLSSGKQSPWYFDIKSALMDSRCLFAIERLFRLHFFKDLQPSYVGGPANAAYSLVTLLGRLEGVKGFVVRKKSKTHGLKRLVDGWEPEEGQGVVLVDDVFTTGLLMASSINYVYQRKAEILAIVPIIDRRLPDECNHHLESKIQPLLRLEHFDL